MHFGEDKDYKDEEIKDDWTTNDDVILQANPLAIEVEAVYKDLISKRTKAISQEGLRENFLTKHCNIIYQGLGTESYIDVAEVQKCKVAKIDWSGRNVYVGVDLAISHDNCAVAISIVENEDGTLNKDQVMRELSDYSMVMNNCAYAYSTMTQQRISKQNTMFLEVESIFYDLFIDKQTAGDDLINNVITKDMDYQGIIEAIREYFDYYD